MKFTIIPLLLLLLFSCSDKKEPDLLPARQYCGTTDPLEDIEWLNEIIEVMELNANATGGQIIAWKYNGDDVFMVDDCYNCADKVVVVCNCAGEVICEFGGISGQNTCPDFDDNATDSIMLYNNVAPEYLYITKK